jgi:twitching motility protein PilI
VSWLAVKAGGRNYLFPLSQSGEIFPLNNLQPVPYCRSWFAGVVNLRGGLFGVVDLAGFLTEGLSPSRSEQSISESSVVTLNSALEVNCALMVEGLAGLRSADAFVASEPPAADAPIYFGNRYTDSDSQMWQEINLQALSLFPQFLSISA